MNDLTMETLMKRMERLERENEWLKRTANLMFVGIGALVIMGQTQCNLGKTAGSKPTKIVEAQEFIVRDASGKLRAKLTESGLTLTDSSGKERIKLALEFDGLSQQLVFRDEDGSPRFFVASYNVNQDPAVIMRGNVELALTGITGAISVSTGTEPSKRAPDGRGPYLDLSGKDRKATAELRPAHLGLWYAHSREPGSQEPRIELDVDDTGSRLTLYDKERGMKPRAVLGSTSLTLIKTGTIQNRSESSLVLFDKEGKVIWQTPR